MRKKYLSQKKQKVKALPYFFLAPTILLFVAFSYYPFLKNALLAFSLTDKRGNFVKWVGFANFQRLFNKSAFWLVVKNTFVFAFIVATLTLLMAMILALISYKTRRGCRIYQTMFSIPMSIASVPASAIFLFMLKKDGFVNRIFGTTTAWLQNASTALPSVAVATVWLSIGASFIFLLVGFRNVPQELLESATIDGAGPIKRAFSIMIPIASPQIFFVVFLNIGHSFKAFGQIKLLTGGGPAKASETLVYSIYNEALQNGRFETACANAIILFLIIFIFIRIQFAVEKKVVFYK
ncbi:MAG: sugar ABC transporter permease [Petrimonas sp.]|nr:sugar ABC transporter permease [Sphaerochaetaceae bacterium]MDX9776035.1 sugar ABC transporter permease [Petrimonas sp.]